jgi:glycosyltransferase involved in cell wall biosynthesis
MKNSLETLPSAPKDLLAWPWNYDYKAERLIQTGGFTWPKVSIVTPSFNQGQFLEETIRSVLMQGYPNLEYIIIDGGSNDESIEIIRKYEKWLTYWVSEPDAGQADAINKGFRKSCGDYFGWINSDDLLYPQAITRTIKTFLSDKEVDLIYGDVEQGWSTGKNVKQLYGQQIDLKEMLVTLQVPIPQQGSLWKRSVIERLGGLDERWQVVLDREFFTRVAEKCNILYLPGVLGFFRHHSQSKSISQQRSWLIELPKMYLEFFERNDLPQNIKNLEGRTKGMVFLTCVSIALQCGEYRSVLSYMIKIFEVDPMIFFRAYARTKITNFIRKNIFRINTLN